MLLAFFAAARTSFSLLLPLLPLLHAAPSPLDITVTHARSGKGHVRCLLFTTAAGFPSDATKATARANAAIANGSATCHFDDAGSKPLAISVIHDEDDDEKLGTNLFGIPTEGTAFSNGARSSAFGPPTFAAASISPSASLTLKLTY